MVVFLPLLMLRLKSGLDVRRQRRREIALRIALGAPASRLVRQVLGDGVRLAAAGGLVGVAISAVAGGWVAAIAPTASAPPFWIWLAAPAALSLVVAIAAVLPARRALSVDPLAIMR